MSTSSSSTQRSSHESLTEVFKCKSCVLILMDYDEERTARFIRLVEFVINLVMASMDRALVTCVCMVNQLQWPIAKDSPIIRVGQRSFVLGFPGLLYGLQLVSCCEPHVIDSLSSSLATTKILIAKELVTRSLSSLSLSLSFYCIFGFS